MKIGAVAALSVVVLAACGSTQGRWERANTSADDVAAAQVECRDAARADTEQRLTEQLGTRVKIERKDVGGKVIIDFISADDLNAILELLNKKNEPVVAPEVEQAGLELAVSEIPKSEEVAALESTPDEDIYDLTNFSI